MTPINEKRMSILLDTIGYYNSSTRSYNFSTKSCSYIPAHANTQGCAVGRLLPIEIASSMEQGDPIYWQPNWVKLPDDLKELGAAFLRDIQHLHDNQEYWNKVGLSEFGVTKTDAIKEHIESEWYDDTINNSIIYDPINFTISYNHLV